MTVDDVLTFVIEKPAAGGRMLARHNGRVVLVAGAIPGETVTARVERVAKGLAFAQTVDVDTASPDRRDTAIDPRCGGNVFSHIRYDRQLQIKRDIVADAFARIAHAPLPELPAIVPSPEGGYRLRARFHVSHDRLGFYREGSHQLCDAAATGQLSQETVAWLRTAERRIQAHGLHGIAGVELGENIAGDERACHLEVGAVAAENFTPLAEGLTGLSVQRADRQGVAVAGGEPMLEDTLRPTGSDDSVLVRLRRDVRSFFQGNRFLVQTLARHVTSLVPGGPVVDLYAGIGLFGLSLAALGHDVTLVEGERGSGADLRRNAEPFGDRVQVAPMSVETFVASGQLAGAARQATVVVDPPLTGLSGDALNGIIAAEPPRLIYVSCDPATLARDSRRLLDSGYSLANLTLFDMFPNTAHVEAVGVFGREH